MHSRSRGLSPHNTRRLASELSPCKILPNQTSSHIALQYDCLVVVLQAHGQEITSGVETELAWKAPASRCELQEVQRAVGVEYEIRERVGRYRSAVVKSDVEGVVPAIRDDQMCVVRLGHRQTH